MHGVDPSACAPLPTRASTIISNASLVGCASPRSDRSDLGTVHDCSCTAVRSQAAAEAQDPFAQLVALVVLPPLRTAITNAWQVPCMSLSQLRPLLENCILSTLLHR